MTEPATVSLTGECYRCGYDLRGIPDEQACPECGLLAERSRRGTDELHDTRPRWLRGLYIGAILILLAILIASAWAMLVFNDSWNFGYSQLSASFPRWGIPILNGLGFIVGAGLLFCGVVLLTRPEGYPPADRADRQLRRWLRIVAFIPAVAIVVQAWSEELPILQFFRGDLGYWFWQWGGLALFILGMIPLPLLLFLRLRGLAQRARSAHLAEHCAIVGIGTSATVLFSGIVALLSINSEVWGLDLWMGRSPVAMGLMLLTPTAGILFTLWSLYLFVRFTVAFGKAARQLRRKWESSDRSTPVGPGMAGNI